MGHNSCWARCSYSGLSRVALVLVDVRRLWGLQRFAVHEPYRFGKLHREGLFVLSCLCPVLSCPDLLSLTVRSVHLSVSLFSAWSLLLFLLTAGMRRQLLFSCLGLTAVIEYPNSLKRPRTDTQDVCAQRVHVGMQLHE